MQIIAFPRTSRFQRRSSWLGTVLFVIVAASSGCQSAVYHVSNLPVEYLPPPPMNAETINISNLADSSVSCKVIQPGDVLEITMVTDFEKIETTSTPVRVADDGSIVVPLIGKVGVAGMEAEQAEQVIAAESVARGVFRHPYITVTMKQFRTNRITVVGAVNNPGTVELPRGSSTLLGAIVAAGGLSKEAGEEVEIRRTDFRALSNINPQNSMTQAAGPTAGDLELVSHQQMLPHAPMPPALVKVNLTAATQGAEKAPELHDGDVVNVAKRMPRPVYVLGLVRKPGEFPFPADQEMHLLDAIALAGGCSNPLAENIMVIRQPAGKAEPIRIAVSLNSAKQGQENIALAPGDTVSVEQTALTAVADVLQTFVRVGLGASMSVF
jgi:polysaccharide export outer membrane protein